MIEALKKKNKQTTTWSIQFHLLTWGIEQFSKLTFFFYPLSLLSLLSQCKTHISPQNWVFRHEIRWFSPRRNRKLAMSQRRWITRNLWDFEIFWTSQINFFLKISHVQRHFYGYWLSTFFKSKETGMWWGSFFTSFLNMEPTEAFFTLMHPENSESRVSDVKAKWKI